MMRKLSFCLILGCLTMAVLLPFPVTAESAADLIVKGDQLFDSGKFQEALAVYEESIALDGGQPRAWAGMGYAQNALHNYTGALASFDRAIALNPNYGKAWYEKGNALYGLQRYDDAIAAYDQALTIYPEYAYLAYYGKARSLQALGRYDDAVMVYEKALSLKPDYAPGWNNLGETLAELARYPEAAAAFDKALALNPGYVAAEKNRQNMTSLMKDASGTTPAAPLNGAPASATTGALPATREQTTQSRPTRAPAPGVLSVAGVLTVAAAWVISRNGY